MTDSTFFNFAEHQQQARRHTLILAAAFVLITAVIAAITGLVVGALLGGAGGPEGGLDLNAALMVALVVLAIILLTAAVRAMMLGGDGARVAQSLGGTEVTRDSLNPAQRRLHNVVEEIAIAAGLPVPRVFVIKHEPGINAFAAGNSPETAAIGITHGALSSLNRRELTAIIAHEFAHIANGDMRLNIRLMAMIFGLVALSVAGRMLMQGMMFRGRRRDQRAVLVAMAVSVTLMVLGALGILAGRVLQAAISRRRESLADATAVEFTREPSALANALKKIGALQKREQLNNAHGEEVRHMLFAEAVSRFSPGLLATHPPLVERIRAIQPDFDPETDPVWRQPQKEMIRDSRKDLGDSSGH